jgi:hypothetical protein
MHPKSFPRPAALLGAALLLAGACVPASAWELAGRKTVALHTRDGQVLTLGTVAFQPGEGGLTGFVLAVDHARFKDYFLSMKEFKCLDGQGEVFCHVPYPYRQPGTVTATDFGWLEHGLLFMFKRPSEFGAQLWNGVYFRLQAGERGLVGTPQAVDLNLIGVPPAQSALPPYRPALRSDIPAGARWASHITIE